MNTEDAFLNCNIWSVYLINQPYMEYNFFLVESVYYHNSLTSGIIKYNPQCMQIPQFEIKDIHLLDELDYELLNKHTIPVLSRVDDSWKIDLSMYHKIIQSLNIGENRNV